MEKSYWRNITSTVMLAVLIVLSFLLLKPILLSIITGIILAFIFSPLYKKTFEKVKSKNLAATLVLLLFVLIILVPILAGFFLGVEGLAGVLAGGLISGFPLALTMANAGGAWDNAKKYIEAGNLGGKGSPAHKAAVIGDMVGDPFKDTSGPAIDILIELIGKVALIFLPLFL